MKGLFSAWYDWRERRAILRELRRQQGDAREQNRFRARDLLKEAMVAIDLNDHRKGGAIWADVAQRYPREIRSSPLALQVLLKLHRYDEAEALMSEGRKKHPGDSYFAKGLAEVAVERGDFDAAIERCAALRKRFPGIVEGYLFGAHALARKNRLDEAEVLAEQAMKRFPEEIRGFLEYARVAEQCGDWADALRRWQIVEDVFTHRTFGAYGRARALIKLERYDEAEEILAVAHMRFPTDAEIMAELARCAQAKGDVSEAVRRWKYQIEHLPMESFGYYGAVEAFKEMGEYAEAEAMIRAAIDRFPLEERPIRMLAEFLRDRQDLFREIEAWELLRRNFPHNESGYIWGGHALRRAGQAERADALLEEHESRFHR